MSSRRSALAGLIVAGLVMALAVIAWPEEAHPPGPAPAAAAETAPTVQSASTVATSPPPEVTTTTEVASPDTAPPLDLTADTFEELRGVWTQIDAYWAWLHANPTDEPQVLEGIFHPDGDQFFKQTETMRGLRERGWRLIADTAIGEVTAFGCCPEPQAEMDTGSIKLAIQTIWPAETPPTVFDVEGAVVETLSGWDLASWLVTLRRADDGRWLVVEVERR